MSDADKTVVIPTDRRGTPITPLRVQFPGTGGRDTMAVFRERFIMGRSSACDVHIGYDGVSRQHVEIYPDGARWWIRDLGSSNGTYLDGKRIQQSPLPTQARIGFFEGSPEVQVSWDPASRVDSVHSRAQAPPASRETIQPGPRRHTGTQSVSVLHRHIERMTRSHRRQLTVGMAVMALLLAAALGVIVHQYRDRQDALKLASEIFYQTKALELELSRLKQELSTRPGAEQPPAVRETSRRLQDMQQRYVSFTEEMKLIGSHRSKEDLLIFRVARVFGEYDLSIPDDFVQEVKRYIRKWQQSPRLEHTMSRINAGGRGDSVARAMRERDLPPHFLYLAVQESDFRTDAIGPVTRFGIPKGMWQFIPQTAASYGLSLGPEKEKRVFDPGDERFDFDKSTQAAADYLRFLYTTDAQGSGLLVMSAYNWGYNNLRRKLNRLPQNPAERNFWRLLQSQQIPDETYGYVLSIVAAAVIGEDPEHFGFSFQNPLADL